MKERKVNVLLTGLGSTTAISVIKGLRKQNEFDVFVVGADINEKSDIAGSGFCDKFFRVPLAVRQEAYVSALTDIVKSESIDLVIPIIDIELEIVARHRRLFEPSTFVLVSSYESIRLCNDKWATHVFFEELNIPTVKTALVEDADNVVNILAESGITFPLIVKPRRGVSSRDVYEIRGEEELSLVKRVREPLIQEKAEGLEYTIDVFCDGKQLISAVPRKRIETRGGISYKGQTEKDETLIGYAKRIAEELTIKGPANIQCFKNNDEVKFVEVNPRFSGGLPLTIAAGMNTPLLALRLAAGQKLDPMEDFKIARMCRYWEEVFYY